MAKETSNSESLACIEECLRKKFEQDVEFYKDQICRHEATIAAHQERLGRVLKASRRANAKPHQQGYIFVKRCFATARPMPSCDGWASVCLSVTFVYCVETAKDTAIVALCNANRKPYPRSRIIPFSMTLNDPVTHISRSRQYSTLNISVTVQDRHT